MDLNSFKIAEKIIKNIEKIEFELGLLSNNENDDYIVSYYDKTDENENDGNKLSPDNDNKKINIYKITPELKNAIKKQLFDEKIKLEEEFKDL